MTESTLLLDLPDPCLLRVLQCCAADDHCSLFSASRAHSRLHNAAVVALRSIALHVTTQQQINGVMVYLGKHCQHVNSLELTGDVGCRLFVSLGQLPPQLQLSSLQLENLWLQVRPGAGSQAVLGPAATAAALKQLRMTECKLLGNGAAAVLAAELSQLPAGLEHLTIYSLYTFEEHMGQFLAGTLPQLQQLTYLELVDMAVAYPDEACLALQPLQALTGLVGLKLVCLQEVVTYSMLSSMQRLTLLEIAANMILEPHALAGKTQLQHLCLNMCDVRGGAAGEAQLLSHLQPLQQLTHLSVSPSLAACEDGNPPASAYAALTASSKLQHLDVSCCTLPAGVWQHLFPAGRQLPVLQSLNIGGVQNPSFEYAQAPEGSRLVSCCPGLQSLQVWNLRSPELALVQGLSALKSLRLGRYGCTSGAFTSSAWQAVCQLTQLRELTILLEDLCSLTEGELLQITQLRQLTALKYGGQCGGASLETASEGDDEFLWRRLRRLYLDHRDPEIAQQAAAALAE